MNPEAFMLLDRLEKLMCSPQSQHPSSLFLGPVASMSRSWKGTLLKFGGEMVEGRVHLGDTFSVPLGSFQSGWPTSPTLWPNSLAIRVPSVCALAGPLRPRLSFLRCADREACCGGSLNVFLLLLIWRGGGDDTGQGWTLGRFSSLHPAELQDFHTDTFFFNLTIFRSPVKSFPNQSGKVLW